VKNLKIETNNQLVSRLRDGDRTAFNEIFEIYWEILYSHAFKRLQDEASAKDVVQNVLLSLWRRRKEVEIKNLHAYLTSALRFQVYRQIAISRQYQHFYEPFEAMMISPIQTDQNLIRDDLAHLLLSWIDTLPRKRRQIFVLHYQKQLSVPEIASELGITHKTVYNQLNNCVKELQWKLAKYYILLFVVTNHIL